MFILNNNSKIKTIEELNKVMSGTNCEYCRHYNNEEYCNGDNPQCDGERNLNNFSFVGIKEIIEEKTDFEKFKNLLDLSECEFTENGENIKIMIKFVN